MAAKKERKKEDPLHPAQAVTAAFDELEDLDCINLLQGGKRVDNALSTNSLALDLILGGGYKPGLMGHIFGPEGSGKSSLALEHIVSAQRSNIPVCLYDPEAGSDPVYMRTMGINLRHTLRVDDGTKKGMEVPGFFYAQPDTGEAIYRHILRVLSRLPIVDDGKPRILFIIDSLAGMGSEEVDEKGEGGRIADEARMHSYFLKRVVPRLRRRGAHLICTNQMRQEIGSYGTPLKPSGGKAIAYWSGYAIRTSAKRAEPDKIGAQTLPVIWRTQKNKAFPPFRSTDNRLLIGRGLDKAFDAFYFLKNLGYIETRAGKHKILLPGVSDKILTWREFRYTVENPTFRAQCFELLKDGKTWRRYFEQSEETTYFYDEDYNYEGVGVPDESLRLDVEQEAAEYADTRNKRLANGKHPKGKSKKEDFADMDLDEATSDEE